MALSTKQLALRLVLLLVYIGWAQAEFNILAELTKLPACGINCFMNVISTGSSCGYNATCICHDEQFYATAQDCIVSECTSTDALEVAKIEAAACERPYRNRKNTLLLPLIIEGPAWLCPWIRLYSRWLTIGRWEFDDYIMLVVGVLYSIFLSFGKYSGQLAFGVDMWNNDYEQIVTALKYFYVCESFYIVTLGLCKLSVVMFYLRIFVEKSFRYAAYVTMGLIIFPAIGMAFVQIFQCHPISLVWTGWRLAHYRDRCMDIHVLVYIAAGINIFQDLLVLALPLPSILRIKVDRRAKCAIFIMFNLGIFVVITSTIRLRYIALFGRSANPTWDYTEVLNWTGIELSVAIIVACVPAIGVLIKRLIPRYLTNLASTYREQSSGTDRFHRKSRSQASHYLKSKNKEHGESQEELGLELSGRMNGVVGVETHVTKDRNSRDGDSARNKAIGSLMGITVTRTVTTVSRSFEESR